MTKRILPILLLLGMAVSAAGQDSRRIVGQVLDEDSSQPVVQAGVELLADKDSVRLDIVVTDMEGKFVLRAQPGDYILKVTYIGCTTRYVPVHQTISRDGVNIGTILLAHEAVGLEASVVTAKADPVTVKEDTVIYNAAAFRVAEDADLDELLKKIPGLEVDPSGGVTLHGRQITQLMVNGKRYFGGDVKTGLKNIPASMVENIKAYDRPSDQARLSGVEDGESEPVLDLTIKKSLMDGWQNNVNVGGGNRRRHYARLNANKITKSDQQTIVASSHNIVGKASINATARNQVGTGGSGDVIFTTAGYTFSREKKNVETAGHFQYSNSDRDVDYRSRSESVQASSSTFGNSNGLRRMTAPVFKGDYNLEWRRDKNFTLIAKAVFQYDQNNNWSLTQGRSFNKDPYAYAPDPNSLIDFDVPDDPFREIRVNATRNTGNSALSRANGSLMVTATIRSAKNRRRSVSFRAYSQLYGNRSDNAGHYLTRYYRIKANPDSVLLRSNYVSQRTALSSNYFYAAFNTPIAGRWSFQSILRADYLYQKQDKAYYDLASVDKDWTVGSGLGSRAVRASLPEGYESGFYDLFSAGGYFERVVLPLTVNVFRNEKKYNIVLGAVLREQMSWLHYGGTVIRQNHFDLSPNIVFRYRFTKSEQLSFLYRSWVAGAPVGSMFPITNGTNPLYISVGNPYLTSPVTHNSTLTYNSSNKKKQNSFTANISYNNTHGAVSTSTVYDEETGVRTSTPQNIDGNWKLNGSLAFTQTFRDKRFSMTNQTGGEFNNNVSYLYNNKLRRDETNVVSRMMIKDRIEGSFRNDWLELLLNGGVDYTEESSLLRPEMSQKPVSWIAGVSSQFSFPWKMRFETDFTTTFQRGYSYDELNINYYIWNAELSQRIMKGKATIRLGWYDILHSQDNLVRTLNASSRSISLYNGVSSYVMLRFFYRFQL